MGETYTELRIRQSFETAGRLLDLCGALETSSALDVGCGAGFDTFALAERFDRVVAIDSAARAVAEGARIARRTGVRNIAFRRADIERFETADKFDLVWCNLMSHNVRSRRRLLRQLAALTLPGGRVIYAEESEGYGLRELLRAVERRDATQLRARVRQLVNGILGRPAFRFFVSTSARREIEALGLDVLHEQRQVWGGLTTVDRLITRRGRSADPPGERPGADPDYTDLPTELEWARSVFASRRARAAVCPGDGARQLAPLMPVADLANAVPGGWRERPSLTERIGTRLPVRVGHREPSWGLVAEPVEEINRLLGGQ